MRPKVGWVNRNLPKGVLNVVRYEHRSVGSPPRQLFLYNDVLS